MTANDIAKLHERTQQFGFEPLSFLISNVDKLHKLSIPEQKQLKFCFIKDAIKRHFKNNPYYKKLCNEYNHKHIPPYRHFSAQDPYYLFKKVPVGEIGYLAIFDPISPLVPVMVQTKKLIFIRKDKTQSYLNSQRIGFVNRIAAAKEFGCCAINLKKNIQFNEVYFSKLDRSQNIQSNYCR